MRVCTRCSVENGDSALCCEYCHTPLESPGHAGSLHERAVAIASEIAIAGGLLMVLGPFLSFGGRDTLPASGLVNTGAAALTIVCAGVIVTVFGILSRVLRRGYLHWYLVCAAATAAVTNYYHLVGAGHDWHAVGLGILFCYLGAVFSFVAGAVCLAEGPKEPLRVSFAHVTASLNAQLAATRERMKPGEVLTYEAARRRLNERR